MENLIFKKIKLYGVKRSVKYGAFEMKYFFRQLFRSSFAQLGEDLIIDKYLKHIKKGFYVDIGAGDSNRFSNTKRFYKKCWRGINVEPDPDSYKKLTENRKNDINLNIGIGEINAELTFYKFFPDTLSTFLRNKADSYKKQGYKFIGEIKVKIKRLDEVLLEYCGNKEIDFMSIDTEGFDIRVLKSNNWNKYKPKLIVIETTKECNSEDNVNVEIHQFLTEQGYKKVFDNGLNSIYLPKIL